MYIFFACLIDINPKMGQITWKKKIFLRKFFFKKFRNFMRISGKKFRIFFEVSVSRPMHI